jgi:DNA-binding transcriptional regulator YiaG
MLRYALRIFMNSDIINTQRVIESRGRQMDDNKMRAIREETGMNRREFCERFDIPYRTVTDWELGNRHAPEYVLRLLEYYIRSEKIYKKEGDKKP